MKVKFALIAVAMIAAAAASPAHAIGCLTGAAAGAVAGHYAHHTILGAVGGCIAGHHLHKEQERKRQEEKERQEQLAHPAPGAPDAPK